MASFAMHSMPRGGGGPPRPAPRPRQPGWASAPDARGRVSGGLRSLAAVGAGGVSTSLSPSSEPGSYRVSGTMTAPVPAHVVWDVLTDYDNQPDIFSSIKTSRVEPDPATGALHIVQTCSWKWLLFGGSFEVRLAVAQADPPSGGGGGGGAPGPPGRAPAGAGPSSPAPASPSSQPGTLVFTLVSSPFLRSFEGTWTVAPCPDRPAHAAVVGHALAVKPTLAPPGPAGRYVGALFERQVGGVLADLGQELGRRAAAAGGGGGVAA